jgi:phospho-N-acetylmuramoyl-pentapeptide-transferase
MDVRSLLSRSRKSMIEATSAVIRPMAWLAVTFITSVAAMPTLIRLLVKAKMGKSIRDAAAAPIMASLHKDKAGTPTMGGIVIWMVTLAAAFTGALVCWINEGACVVNFLSRGQTWLPLGLMIGAALIGLVDDYWNVKRLGPKGGGLRVRHRILSYTLIAAIGAWWFFTKLEWSQMHIPFIGTYNIGWFYIPFFMLTVAATSHSVNVTDGLDGLAGGTLLSAFGAYSIIAWSQGRYDIATLCMVIIGGLLGFLWYNINPAKVFMGDTGAMSLGTVLAVIALMTNQPLLLLVIGLPFVVESGSVLIQVMSKKFRGGKKIFKSTPIHHHLEASGWTEPQIVMRFWMISIVLAGIGTVIALIDRL